MGRRCIGLDVHREFAQVAVWEDGRVRQAGQVAIDGGERCGCSRTASGRRMRSRSRRRATRTRSSDADRAAGRAGGGVEPDEDAGDRGGEGQDRQGRRARSSRELLAADYLPSVWVADEETQALRRQVARRANIVRQRTRLKNQVQAILHRNLVPRCPARTCSGSRAAAGWRSGAAGRMSSHAVEALLRQLDFHGQELRIIDAALGRIALERDEVKRLMTIPGVDATVALSIVAAVGDFRRFRSPEQLVSYLGLNPRVRQSGGQAASHGRITKQGRAHARGMLVEAALTAAQDPRAAARVLQRVRVPARHADRDRRDRPQTRVPVLDDDRTRRGLRVRPPVADREEAPRARAARRDARRTADEKGTAAAYSLKEVRRRELELAEQAEHAYRQQVADWQANAPASKTGVAAANGTRLKRPSAGQAARQASVPEPALRSGVDHAHTEA